MRARARVSCDLRPASEEEITQRENNGARDGGSKVLSSLTPPQIRLSSCTFLSLSLSLTRSLFSSLYTDVFTNSLYIPCFQVSCVPVSLLYNTCPSDSMFRSAGLGSLARLFFVHGYLRSLIVITTFRADFTTHWLKSARKTGDETQTDRVDAITRRSRTHTDTYI